MIESQKIYQFSLSASNFSTEEERIDLLCALVDLIEERGFTYEGGVVAPLEEQNDVF